MATSTRIFLILLVASLLPLLAIGQKKKVVRNSNPQLNTIRLNDGQGNTLFLEVECTAISQSGESTTLPSPMPQNGYEIEANSTKQISLEIKNLRLSDGNNPSLFQVEVESENKVQPKKNKNFLEKLIIKDGQASLLQFRGKSGNFLLPISESVRIEWNLAQSARAGSVGTDKLRILSKQSGLEFELPVSVRLQGNTNSSSQAEAIAETPPSQPVEQPKVNKESSEKNESKPAAQPMKTNSTAKKSEQPFYKSNSFLLLVIVGVLVLGGGLVYLETHRNAPRRRRQGF